MIIKNKELAGFADFLMQFELKGKESRMRTRFYKELQVKVERLKEEEMVLIMEHVVKGEDGTPETVTIDGKENYKLIDAQEFQKEYDILMNEIVIFPKTEDVIEIHDIVADLVLNTDQTFSGEEALVYDRYCEIVES